MNMLLDRTFIGENVTEIKQDEDCLVLYLKDETGNGTMTFYPVFSGAYIMFNDFHISSCRSEFSTGKDLLCIDHCREGRIEQELGVDAYSYLEAGELRIDRRINHAGNVQFPLNHYHGLSIVFDMKEAAISLTEEIRNFSVNLYKIQQKFYNGKKPFVIPGDPHIEHIFSELYSVPIEIRRDYFRIKIFELLLYLSALKLDESKEKRPYFYKTQVEKIKAIHILMTKNLARHFTLAELSEQFEISLTPMKSCFKAVYGNSIFSYMRVYRLNYAATLLRQRKSASIAEIANCVGYDNPGKFSMAFKEVMGRTPLEYRKSIV